MIPIFLAITIRGANLEVGPGKVFARIEAAVAVANTGDTILVYPDPSGYPGTAVRIQTPSITIRGVNSQPVTVTGTGFDYSGAGSVPRAIIQIDPTGTGAKIQNLNLSDAHNQTFNGAGIRIQAANDVTVSDCIIHGNDMGIMSNGQTDNPTAGSNQRIEYCRIEGNGNLSDPGFNHNLYLGGTSAYLSHCEVARSLTGHNVKSRTHYLQVESCYIHDSANREIDLPEAWDTVRPNSNAVLIGNRIVKDPNCIGNRGVVFFGKESGIRNGNLYLLCNTIVTPFSSPVILINFQMSQVFATRNIILNSQQNQATLLSSPDPNQIFVPSQNMTSRGYGKLPGENTWSKDLAEAFGLVIPPYLYPGSVPGKEISVSWFDGNGTKQNGKAAIGMSSVVGPRSG
ncbi:MAG: hypothetical protein WCI55_07665 [Armatimonadota bacterium]